MDQHKNNSDCSDDSGASDRSNDRLINFKCDGNRPEEKRSRHDATLLNPGPPALYRLNTERKYLDGTDKKVRQWTYGRRDRNKQNKVILMVGETGTGKTTMINTMINYLLGVKFEDEEFYQITDEDEDQDQSQSQTSEITVYEAFVEENPTSLTIIDTPGYGDTEGLEKDGEISEYLTRLFSDKDNGIHYIDAVCFVMKASQNRLSGKELYIFHSVLSLFGKDIEDNIVFLLTHSDGGRPTDALNAIKKAEIPCRRDERGKPVHFLFNNRQKEKRDEQYDHLYRSAWEMGDESMNEFFTLLEEENRKSVDMTLDVLKERRRLKAWVSNLKDRIDLKESKMKELNQIQEVLRQNRDKIEKCENFEFTVEKVYEENHSVHVIVTFAELKQEYERTGDQNETNFDKNKCKSLKKESEESYEKIKIEEKLKSDLEKKIKEKSLLLCEAYTSIMSLCKIALKADSAFSLQHLDFLIPRLKEEGKDEWMKELEELKKAGEERKNKWALHQLWGFFSCLTGNK